MVSVGAVGNDGFGLCRITLLIKLLPFALEREQILTAASITSACLNVFLQHLMSLILLGGVSAAVSSSGAGLLTSLAVELL